MVNTLRIINSLRGKVMISDPKTLKNYEVDAFNMTDGLLKVLKKRVPDMNLIGFFIAGSGRSGRVDKRTLSYLQRELSMDAHHGAGQVHQQEQVPCHRVEGLR